MDTSLSKNEKIICQRVGNLVLCWGVGVTSALKDALFDAGIACSDSHVNYTLSYIQNELDLSRKHINED